MVNEFSYLMKKDAAAELGWSEDEGAVCPNWTGLLCLEGFTLDMVLSDDSSLCPAWPTRPSAYNGKKEDRISKLLSHTVPRILRLGHGESHLVEEINRASPYKEQEAVP